MKIMMLDLKRQYAAIRGELEPKVLECLAGGNYIMGENVTGFENEIAHYLGVKHAVSVGNGTDALVISLRALGIGPGDEVVTADFTYFASAEAIAAVGATPVFADVDPESYDISPAGVREKITDKTKAILPVHIFGQPAEMGEIMSIAREHGLKVVEDACQSIGSSYEGKQSGTIGDLGCFSFFPTKNLGAFGDGGLITTDDDRLAVICRALREHGGGKNGAAARDLLEGRQPAEMGGQADPLYNPYKYYNYLIGYNSRMDALQAAILRVKLPHLGEWNEKRARNAAYYCEKLKGCGLALPANAAHTQRVWHQFCVRTAFKEELGAYLAQNGVASGVFYPVPLHLQKAFGYLNGKEGDLPVTEALTKQSLCLPVYPELTRGELDDIVSCVRKFMASKNNEEPRPL